jgi:hypothetical protein
MAVVIQVRQSALKMETDVAPKRNKYLSEQMAAANFHKEQVNANRKPLMQPCLCVR